MLTPSEDYLTDESVEDSQPTVVIPAPTPPTAQQLTLEDLQMMQQMGLTIPDLDSDSSGGIRIPVEEGQMLMGNGPLPIQEGVGDELIINHVGEEEEDETSQTVSSEHNLVE